VFPLKALEGCFDPTGCAVLNTLALAVRFLMHHEIWFAEHTNVLSDAESAILWTLDAMTLVNFHTWLALAHEIGFAWSLDLHLVLGTLLLVASAVLVHETGLALFTLVLNSARLTSFHARRTLTVAVGVESALANFALGGRFGGTLDAVLRGT